jgi:DNA-directed RNA polymerase subunit RPC12/RpoP
VARKYICDNCGTEVQNPSELIPLGFNETRVSTEIDMAYTEFIQIGEYCKNCKAKIEARIKEGVN